MKIFHRERKPESEQRYRSDQFDIYFYLFYLSKYD
jgi:hypothetical protein